MALAGAMLLLVATGALARKDEPAEAPEPAGGSELEAALDEARRQLDDAARQLAELYKRGYSAESEQRPMLGILLGDGKESDGIRLVGVTPGSGAQAAGLKAGDRLVEANGVRLDGGERAGIYVLKEVLAGVEPGDAVSLEYVREGTAHSVEVITQAHEEQMVRMLEQKFDWTAAPEGHAGVVVSAPGLVDVDPSLGAYFGVSEGVLVLKAPPGSELASGDILLELGGKPVDSAGAATLAIAKADGPVNARVRRGGRAVDLSIEPAQFGVAGSLIGAPGVTVIKVEKRPDAPSDRKD
jgi:S1-C subfamily serine protease